MPQPGVLIPRWPMRYRRGPRVILIMLETSIWNASLLLRSEWHWHVTMVLISETWKRVECETHYA